MSIVLLDSGPLGLATNPRKTLKADQCSAWLESLLVKGVRVLVPEIADYEVRRELLRANKVKGIQRLDLLKQEIGYLPITTEVMLNAAELWAEARKQGQPTAEDRALDADVILAAQAIAISNQGYSVTVATTNVGHLGRFVEAARWEEIS